MISHAGVSGEQGSSIDQRLWDNCLSTPMITKKKKRKTLIRSNTLHPQIKMIFNTEKPISYICLKSVSKI